MELVHKTRTEIFLPTDLEKYFTSHLDQDLLDVVSQVLGVQSPVAEFTIVASSSGVGGTAGGVDVSLAVGEQLVQQSLRSGQDLLDAAVIDQILSKLLQLISLQSRQ